MDKTLVLIGILFSSILIVENLVLRTSAYVLIWISTAANLAMLSIFTGVLIGYGVRGLLTGKKQEDDDDGF